MSTSHLHEQSMQRIRLRDLRILSAVVQSGSMGKAAAQLAISQPAVSKMIAELERTLGVPLLDRTARGIEPTLYGRSLLKWAVVVFDDLRQGIRELESLADPTAGELRIGSATAMTGGLVPTVIDRMSRQFPRVVFRVRQAPTTDQQYQELREREVDLILGRMVTPIADADLDVEFLFDDPTVVVAGVNSKWHRRRKIDPAELIDEPWTLPPYDLFVGSLVKEAFQAKGLRLPRMAVESNSIQLNSALLATGRFLSVLSSSTLRLSGGRLSLKVLPVDLPIRSGPVGIVTLKNRTISPAAQLFIECARKVAKQFAKAI